MAAGFVFPYQSIKFDEKSMHTEKAIQLDMENEQTATDEEYIYFFTKNES